MTDTKGTETKAPHGSVETTPIQQSIPAPGTPGGYAPRTQTEYRLDKDGGTSVPVEIDERAGNRCTIQRLGQKLILPEDYKDDRGDYHNDALVLPATGTAPWLSSTHLLTETFNDFYSQGVTKIGTTVSGDFENGLFVEWGLFKQQERNANRPADIKAAGEVMQRLGITCTHEVNQPSTPTLTPNDIAKLGQAALWTSLPK